MQTEAEAIKAVVGEPHGQTEETEDTDKLGEQLEFTQMEYHPMHVHSIDSTENRLSSAENLYPVRGSHMSPEKHKTPPQQHEKQTSSETKILDKYLLKMS